MHVSLPLVEQAITQHLAAKGRTTMPNLAAVTGEWAFEPTPEDLFEEKLHLWLEAADQLAGKPGAALMWAYAMRPWLACVMDSACGTDVSDEDLEAISERLAQYWESRR